MLVDIKRNTSRRGRKDATFQGGDHLPHQLFHGVAMFNAFSRLQTNLSAVQWIAITLFALLFNYWATDLLNVAYAASGFPVPYWEAQLSFDHQKLKGWYSVLQSNKAIDLYIHTQYVDFVFIASVLILHTSALVVVSRTFPVSSNSRQFILWAALLSVIAPLSDAIENGISFIMLANPTSFEPILALAYSSSAAIKFVMFSFAYLAAGGGLLLSLYFWATRAKRGSSAA